MRVLVACEFSGVVRDAFAKRGHDAWSCDLLPSEKSSHKHYQGDIFNILLSENWDMVIAHPPCTYLCNSGVRWLASQSGRFGEMLQACNFFNKLLYSGIPQICVENPIPHKYAKNEIGIYDQIIQPWQFGHGETKATCLWLKNLPKLMPTNIVSGREGKIWKMPPGPNRAKDRSRTYQGIADAMAEQWGDLT